MPLPSRVTQGEGLKSATLVQSRHELAGAAMSAVRQRRLRVLPTSNPFPRRIPQRANRRFTSEITWGSVASIYDLALAALDRATSICIRFLVGGVGEISCLLLRLPAMLLWMPYFVTAG